MNDNRYEPLMDLEHFTELFVLSMVSDVEGFDGKTFKYDWNNYTKEIEETLTTDFNDDVNYNYLIDMNDYNKNKDVWNLKFASELRYYSLNGNIIPGLGKNDTYVVFNEEYIKEKLEQYNEESKELMHSFVEKVKYFDSKKHTYETDMKQR